SQARQPLSGRKKTIFSIFVTSFCVGISFVFAELVVREKGHRPWLSPVPYVAIQPAGNYFRPDPVVGYLPRPGRTMIELPGQFSFSMTHLSNGLRITHSLDTYPSSSKKALWIFGCSFTHGWSLNDEQTYPWLIQQNFPEYDVVNFGVEAYST